MTTKLLQSSIFPPLLSISMELSNPHRPFSTLPNINNKTRLAISDNQDSYFGTRSTLSCFSTRAVPDQLELQSPDDDYSSVPQLKALLYDCFQGINRGIFGVTSAKKSEIENLVKLLESKNPTLEPTGQLQKLAGTWKLVYSTITILGSKRTKLGLRDFISLGDFLQIINVAEEKAVNVIKFSARGFDMLSGQLQINASFKIASKARVEISYDGSTITPEQLMSLFRKNYDLLLNIFNPDGWLEITYVDDTLRIGRDNKGNTFILERLSEDDEQAIML